MGFRINTNIAAMNSHMHATQNNVGLDKSLTALSSGLRINKAADDASGLAIANQLSAQSEGLGQAIRNSNDGIAMIQTADGALDETGNILNRVRTLSVQAANDTQTDSSRAYIQEEITALIEELDVIAGTTSFNGQNLLDGTGGSTQVTTPAVTAVVGANEVDTFTAQALTAGQTVILDGLTYTSTGATTALEMAETIRTGVDASANGVAITGTASGDYTISGATTDAIFTANAEGPLTTLADTGTNAAALADTADGVTAVDAAAAYDTATFTFHTGAYTAETTAVSVKEASSTALGVNALDVTTQAGAEAAIASVDAGIVAVDTLRSTLGAAQNKLESTVRNISVTQVNVASAESQIRDVDFAAESANFSKHNILAQSGSYAMSQANAVQQNVLRLLQ
jgi:flagellin